MLYDQATRCFEGLMEISLNTDTVKDFAKRHELDIKYLVDGANFVISKMHFNPEENFYVILGLPRNATPEEIRQRWKNLMLLYHPDKQTGDEEWVSERAKKVNEAYTTLKDDARRSEYDRKLSGSQLNGRFPSHVHHTSDVRHERPSRAFSRSSRSSYGEPSAWDRFRTYLPKAMIGVYAIAAGIFLLYIYQQNRSATLESELLARQPQQTQLASQEQVPPTPLPIAPAAESQPGTPVPQAERNAAPAEKSAERHTDAVSGKTAQEKAAAQKEAGKPAPAGMKSPQREKKKLGFFDSLFRSSENSPAQERHKEQRTEPEMKPTGQMQTEQKPAEPQRIAVRQETAPLVSREAKAEQAQPLKDEAITQDEVDAFMKRYIRAYTQNDLDGFMALFSRSAVENNTMTYQDIRNAYRETFREKINYYKVQNMDIRTEGQKATVSGTYIVNRYISAEDRWVKYTGRIVWRLARENSQLKIVSTNYDK